MSSRDKLTSLDKLCIPAVHITAHWSYLGILVSLMMRVLKLHLSCRQI